jgi:hypothetical protein
MLTTSMRRLELIGQWYQQAKAMQSLQSQRWLAERQLDRLNERNPHALAVCLEDNEADARTGDLRLNAVAVDRPAGRHPLDERPVVIIAVGEAVQQYLTCSVFFLLDHTRSSTTTTVVSTGMAAPNCVVGARVNLSTGEYGVPLLHEGLREFVMIECAPATAALGRERGSGDSTATVSKP